jgi:hypothetical protein
VDIVGLATLTIKKSGRDNDSLFLGKVYGYFGSVVSAGTGRVHIQLVSPQANVYGWNRAGRLLTLTKISDPLTERAAVLTGVWERK